MIIDLERFIEAERPYWQELEAILERLARDHTRTLNLAEVRRFHHLYERVSADLAKLATFASERDTRRYLESLVARAYGEIHETRRKPHRLRPLRWLTGTLPRTFRKHAGAFRLSATVTLLGCLFGAAIIALDPESKSVVVPFQHLMGSPSERVTQEEEVDDDALRGIKARGAAWYMTHNTRVCLYTLALGATWGIGVIAMLFYNGVILGAVATDYVLAGESAFLAGWLLPHGSVEIPAILVAGQAAFVLAGAMIGWGRRLSLRERLREVVPDLVTLVGGIALLLVWAGIVESFLSQYHEPVIPYAVKIVFGSVQLAGVIFFLSLAGRGTAKGEGSVVSERARSAAKEVTS